MNDDELRARLGQLPVPDFSGTAFTTPPPLSGATVAIVTTAALRHRDDEPLRAGDQSFRVIDSERRDLVLDHWSANFDRSGLAADLNVVFPIDRLKEMEATGQIGRIASQHLSFLGAQDETMSTIRLDSGPAAAKLLRDEGVDVVLLTPI